MNTVTKVRHDYAKPDPAAVGDWIGNVAAIALLVGLAWRLW